MDNKINFKALGRVIIVLKPQVNEQTKSGLYKGEAIMKEEAKSKESEYLDVLAVGNLVEGIEAGDKILVNGTITTCVINGIQCGFLYEGSVIGKLL